MRTMHAAGGDRREVRWQNSKRKRRVELKYFPILLRIEDLLRPERQTKMMNILYDTSSKPSNTFSFKIFLYLKYLIIQDLFK